MFNVFNYVLSDPVPDAVCPDHPEDLRIALDDGLRQMHQKQIATGDAFFPPPAVPGLDYPDIEFNFNHGDAGVYIHGFSCGGLVDQLTQYRHAIRPYRPSDVAAGIQAYKDLRYNYQDKHNDSAVGWVFEIMPGAREPGNQLNFPGFFDVQNSHVEYEAPTEFWETTRTCDDEPEPVRPASGAAVA